MSCNFQVKASPKEKDYRIENDKMIRTFTRKWKKSGILKDLKDKSYPRTRGMKSRLKRYLGKKRSKKSK